MLGRLFGLLIGFGLAVAGGISLLAYLNFIAAGYDVISYFILILARLETYLFIAGLILIFMSLYAPGKKNRKKGIK